MEWNQIIRNNQRWLATYFVLARLTGWILIVFGLGRFIGGIYYYWSKQLPRDDCFYGILFDSFTNGILPGLLALVMAAFLRYLLKPDERVGVFLAHGSLVLRLAAVVYLVKFLYIVSTVPRSYPPHPSVYDFLGITSAIMPILLFPITQILIAIGLAQALSRMLDVINESKSLV